MEWTVGDVTITSIVEQDLDFLNELIVTSSKEEIQKIEWLVPNYADDEGLLLGLIQSFVVTTPSCTLMVDTCVGNDKDRPVMDSWHKAHHAFMEHFRDAGFDPAKIDYVLCTHMHMDHVGWNTFWDGTAWQPTFSNARYLFADTEMDHWKAEYQHFITNTPDSTSRFKITQKNTYEDSVKPIMDAGLADLVTTTHQVCPEIQLYPTPGHTPGHVSILIQSQGAQAIITGDCVHHPCQIAHPEWHTGADTDKSQSSSTREDLFAELDGTRTLLIGSHFCEPTAGHIKKDGNGYRFVQPGAS